MIAPLGIKFVVQLLATPLVSMWDFLRLIIFIIIFIYGQM